MTVRNTLEYECARCGVWVRVGQGVQYTEPSPSGKGFIQRVAHMKRRTTGRLTCEQASKQAKETKHA